MSTSLLKFGMKPKKPNPSGSRIIDHWRVWVDRDLCIGAATCVVIAAKTFAMDKENKAVILNSADKETKENLLNAAKSCPVAAIIIEDKNKKRIYPK